MRRGEIQGRVDVNYLATTSQLLSHYARPIYPLVSLRSIIDVAQYGISALATSDPIGVPILRMNNLQDDGWDFSDLKYLDLPDKDLARYRLEKGDILFNRTNSKELVGKCEVFKDDGNWVFASYLIRVQVNKKTALPEFVSTFLNTKSGRLQIDRVSRQIIGMSNVNAEELKELEIPLPPLAVQRTLVADMESARALRQSRLAQADELLKGMDDFVLEQLGLEKPNPSERKTFAVAVGALRNNKTMNPDYFHPERMEALRVIQKSAKRLRVEKLGEIADFIRDIKTVDQNDDYVGLASVQSNTGELLPADEKAQGQCFKYERDDVLFGRLRPYLNKIHSAKSNGVCSTEFHVIRVHKTNKVKEQIYPEYLAAILRSSVILAQTKHMMTGNTHPRLTNEDVINLVVPIPEIEVQKSIVVELSSRRETAQNLRVEAETDWQTAKQKFERALLG